MADEVILSTGVRVRMRPIPRALLHRVQLAVSVPDVPTVTVGDREQPNPVDPDYLAAIDAADVERYRLIARLMLSDGIEIVDCGSVLPVEDDGWVERLESAGLIINREQRQAEWLELVAMATDEDVARTFEIAQRGVGLLEWEVLAEMRFFPDLAGRRVAA
jgi:hypothetical protein